MSEDPATIRKDEKETSGMLASAPIRIAAFGMDFVLLFFISMLIMLYLPKALGEQTANEFDNLTSRVAELFQETEPDQRKLDNILRELQLFQKRINYNLIVTLFFVLYFFQAEFFWGGKSIGKATFSLHTKNTAGEQESPLTTRQIIIRSLIKGLSCSFYLLGLANLLCFLLNKQKKCLHDLASGTITGKVGSGTDKIKSKSE
jgi:uncharacterized RDD family membrane protein YckC